MSVEHSVSAGAPKAAQSAAGGGAARKPAGNAEAGGFAALLMSFGTDELSAETGLALGASEGQTEQPGADGDAAALNATDALALPPTEQIRQDTAPADAEVAGVSGMAAAARGRTGALAVSADVLQHTNTNTNTERDAGQSTADSSELSGGLQPLLRQAGLAQRLAQQRSQSAEGGRLAQSPRGDDVGGRQGWQIVGAQPPAGGGGQVLLATGLGESGLRPFQERHADKYGVRVGEAGAWAGVASLDGARLDVPVVAPDAGLMTEMRVAEQVSYHVGRGVQSADLEVEGIDERPIHVSIDLQGQEARIEFRAEQAQTRQVLQDAMPHLREMLEREGLTLAGMSVGGSGPQGGQEQPSERGRSGVRQVQVESKVEGAASAAGARSALPSGRSLDLYV